MNELRQEVIFAQAKLDHQRLLKDSAEARLIHTMRHTTPKLWDAIALTTGNWLIKLGNSLKEQSVYTKLSEKHA